VKPSYSLIDFLRTGRLGCLRVGSTRGEVLHHAGEPEQWVPWGKTDWPQMEARSWHYGLFQFHFSGSVISNLGLYYTLAGSYGLPHRFELRDASPMPPDWDAFKTWLASHELLTGAIERPRAERLRERELVLASSVVVFGRDDVISIRSSTLPTTGDGELSRAAERAQWACSVTIGSIVRAR
jgi:hypothetical protein